MRTSTAAVGKRAGRGAKIKLAPRPDDVLFARAGDVKIDLPYLMHSLVINDEAKSVDVSARELSKKESEENMVRNLNSR